MVESGIAVHLSGGFIEAHFHFFVMVPIVALYENWLPFGLSVGYVLFQHGIVGTLDTLSGLQPPQRPGPPVVVGGRPRDPVRRGRASARW